MPTWKLPVGHSSWVVLMAEFGKCFAGTGSSRLELISRCSVADCLPPEHRNGVWHGVFDLYVYVQLQPFCLSLDFCIYSLLFRRLELSYMQKFGEVQEALNI